MAKLKHEIRVADFEPVKSLFKLLQEHIDDLPKPVVDKLIEIKSENSGDASDE